MADAAIDHLASSLVHVIAAGEPSKAPFYVVGGALAAWAVVLSAIGLSRPEFPGSQARARAVMGISAVLVAGTMATAIATVSRPTEGESRAAQPPQRPPSQGQVGGASGGGAKPQPAPAGAASTLQVATDPSGQLAYEQKSLTAKAGKVTIRLTNKSPVAHDVTIEQGGRRIGGTSQITGSTTSATVDLRPGTYTFYCSVDAHRQAGMQGPLTVR